NLQYPYDYPASGASEKGIDVAIAVDMIRLGMSGYMDAALLFSLRQRPHARRRSALADAELSR
ncbi:MAG TPA: hypothetical protein PLF56_13275, partial [Micropruina sp.]|nr:hypothetical protein [Micropruina sp.]